MTTTPYHLRLDARAMALMVLLCALWGLQQVAVKVALPDISPVMQGGLRSIIAMTLLLAWARARSLTLFDRDGTLGPGLVAGALFAAEFLMIYYGLPHTTASRMVVFLYLAPCLTAVGLALLVPGERLSPIQWTGTLVAFAGIVVAFADGLLDGVGLQPARPGPLPDAAQRHLRHRSPLAVQAEAPLRAQRIEPAV